MTDVRLFVSVLFLMTPLMLSAVEYEKDIMPIFEKKCGECHSKDGKAKGGLKLDDPQHFYNRFGKNNLVKPGNWDASYLFVTLFRPADAEEAMPPQGKGERLTPAETRLVQQWIADGAPIVGEKGEKGEMPKEGDLGYIAVAEENNAEEKKPMTGVEQNWTNTEGKTIRATLLRVEGAVALLQVKDGRVYRVPVEKLNEESRKQLGVHTK